MELRRGRISAEVVPWAGGLVRRFRLEHRGTVEDILHAPAHAEPSTQCPNAFGLWPLVPFANRAFDARIDDGTDAFEVAANEPGCANAIHGFGWQAEWDVVDADADRLRLRHRREAGPDPYRYSCEQIVTLIDPGLRIDLSVTNEADRALPFGLGLHPWFPADPDVRLTLKAERALTLGPGYRPTGIAALGHGGPFAHGAPVRGEEEVALSFLGWDGRARVDYPSRGYALAIRAAPALAAPLLWAPPGAAFFCLEPQTHAIGAPSEPMVRALTPLKRLEPGEMLAVWLTLEVLDGVE